MQMLQLVLQPLLLRRTKHTKNPDGSPILVLPSSNVEILRLEMTEPERDFYKAIYTRSRTRFAEFQAAGKVMSNYANVLEMLLRLRQACDREWSRTGRMPLWLSWDRPAWLCACRGYPEPPSPFSPLPSPLPFRCFPPAQWPPAHFMSRPVFDVEERW